MGKNKKRDKKNFRRQKEERKENIEGADSKVVSFLNEAEINKMKGLNSKAKKNLKNYNKKYKEDEAAKQKEEAHSEQSEELGFGEELDNLIYDNQYELESGNEAIEDKPAEKQENSENKGGSKPSISNAILDILGTEENPQTEEKCAILSKNSRPFKLLEKEKKQTKDEKKKIYEKELIRRQGRRVPSLKELDYEKNLQMIATKGVVRLFNAVSHQQTEIRREVAKDEKIREEFVSKKLEMDKSKHNSNETILRKIQSKEKRWKAFEDDEEGEEQEQ
ncbi:unnamed protein product [Moneuplotes crassus]|uniref:RRP15-like protein n=1 Tax=Euplotes crassus TaxID=5936 RepID=A0AAD2D254_EUPCR|nr:unnamed protein product [Moneuplotes crassus]